MPGIVGDVFNWVISLVETSGYLGLAVVVGLENVFPPIPSEAILPLAGFLVGQGRMTLVGAVGAATAGSLGGALVLYWIGYALGEKRVRTLIQRYGQWALLDEDDLDQAKGWFDHHGRAAVFLARLAPLARSLISVPAGVAKMPLVPFIIYTTVGSGIWNAVLIAAGWLLGANWGLVERYQGYFGTAFVTLMAATLVWFVARRLMNGRRIGGRDSDGQQAGDRRAPAVRQQGRQRSAAPSSEIA
ncbi:MAG: DedA family protein [Chloroflexota bacterium]